MKHQSLDIVFEDDYLVAVNKPADLLTLPDRFNHSLPNLRAMLEARYGAIFVVHRLDKLTSGLVLFAKDSETHKQLNEQFQARTIRKIYHALVSGIMQKDDMEVDIPLEPDPAQKGLMRPNVRGKESLTILHVVKRFRIATLLECELVTGRQHQIRVHCATIGHPLLVDADYGSSADFRLSTIKRKFNLAKDTEERPVIARTTLHAYRIEFDHPHKGERLYLEAPYHKDFRAALQVLEKYAPYQSYERDTFI